MHQDIKRFSLDGNITSDAFLQERERLIEDLEADMRDQGYVPVLDLLPHFTREYDAESEAFTFILSCYGTEVGEEESWAIAGIMNGRAIPRSTPMSK